jgi:methionyl-tRNA formyltransferase
VAEKFKIIFLGTPDFAVPCLEALHAAGHDVALVVTQPDRPKGRGRKVEPPPVKRSAERLGCAVIQPASMRDRRTQRTLKAVEADFFVVVAFGRILPQAVLDLPGRGCVNVHASLLPKYRGPAPIHWSIINGESRTGVSTMLMDEGVDTGDILKTADEAIDEEDTTGSLHDRLARKGAEVLVETLAAWAAGSVRPQPQDHSRATYAPLLKKSDGQVDWKKPARDIRNFIRGMTPWPGAYTFFGGMRLKLFKAAVAPQANAATPGTVLAGPPGGLWVATGEGALSILEIQGASGNRLAISDFLRGHPIPPREMLV